MVEACLSGPEQRLMANFRHPRRRLEFVAGRLALKGALLDPQSSAVRIGSSIAVPDRLLSKMRRLQVLPEKDGRPRLWTEGAAPPVHVSIAHAAGWAAAACSNLPIGVDIVDVGAPTAVPDDTPWLAGVEPEWRTPFRALLWALRECLLKCGQVAAKTVWALEGVYALPACTASEIVAGWPQEGALLPFNILIEDKAAEGALVTLNPSLILVVVSMPAPQQTIRKHLQ